MSSSSRQDLFQDPAADVSLVLHPDGRAAAPLSFRRCSCPACMGAGPVLAEATTASAAVAAPAAALSLESLANYLTTGFWQQWGELPFRFNLGDQGIGAKNGTITYNITGWADDSNGLTPERRELTREIFRLYSAVLGIDFLEVSGDGGDIRFSDNDSGAYSYLVSGWFADESESSLIADYCVVNVETGWYDGKSDYNTYLPQTIFHEVGHSLGLGHQGLYNYEGAPLSYGTSAQFANDSWQASMMSYWDQTENPTTGASFAWLHTPMAVDWIALDDLYGSQGFGVANAFQGDTVYGVGTNISADVSRIWNDFSLYAGLDAFTLVDGDGYDTLNVSNFSANQLINLAPSEIGSTTPSRSNIGGKIGNLTIAAGTVVEAAVGGSGADGFYGNAAGNAFWGQAGNDRFYDSPGSDRYYGDAGIDTVYFSDAFDQYSFSLDANGLAFTPRAGGVDVDWVAYNVETISFNSVAYSYQQLVATFGSTSLPAVTIQSANGSLISGAVTRATTFNFQGSLSNALASNQEIAVYRDGIRIGTATPAGPGSSSWTFATSESPGTRTVVYTARVVAIEGGEVGVYSSPFELNIDTEAPLVSVDALQTYDATPLLSGSVSDPTASVTVRIGAITQSAVNNGNGRWSLQWNNALSPGTLYDVLATAVDAAGNSRSDSSSGELRVLADDFRADSSTAGLLAVGGSRGANLEFQGDHDWFAVDLQAGRTYAFHLNGTTLIDPMLSLYSANGTLLASNDDIQTAVQLNSLITYVSRTGGRVYLDAGAYADAGTGGYTISVEDVTPAPILYFTLASSVSSPSPLVMGGLTARTNDIISYNGRDFQVWLNGNSSGLAGAVLRDFQIINNDEVVVAFQSPVTLSGIRFETADLAKLTRNGSGFAISMFFDGSDVGLTTSAEAIDAVTGLADGSWAISTRGRGSVPQGAGSLAFAPEDLLLFRPTSLGSTTAGVWSLYADTSDVGLSTSWSSPGENVVAVDVTSSGRLVMATQGTASAVGLNAANEDVFSFQPTALGSTTSGAFQKPLLFDGSQFGLGANALMGLDVPG